MSDAGHVTINAAGALVGVDSAFCRILKAQPATVRGRLVLDVTAPADRVECAEALGTLRRTGKPFSIVKRFLCDDGTLAWVRNTVSLTSDGVNPDVIVATVEPVIEPAVPRHPAVLLAAARFLVANRRDRSTVYDASLFSAPAWDAILIAYIAEAEGRRIGAAGLAEVIGHPRPVIRRWIKALEQHDVFELETRDPQPDAEKCFRLTSGTHRRLETYLADIGKNAPAF